ncbi:hypothetical protein TNIN_430191 [Trichonephila inaurata madagascariensis]|uniref:Uncharacterized protein n=1 Tax=Trichonephila inaurata madagascariensis TaxID=2747483 RepID=A0A8X6XYH7_9ARAC|nr:hypothetical protein TNIN_430191 [Trichonephila inaurata madagascariensis]
MPSRWIGDLSGGCSTALFAKFAENNRQTISIRFHRQEQSQKMGQMDSSESSPQSLGRFYHKKDFEIKVAKIINGEHAYYSLLWKF